MSVLNEFGSVDNFEFYLDCLPEGERDRVLLELDSESQSELLMDGASSRLMSWVASSVYGVMKESGYTAFHVVVGARACIAAGKLEEAEYLLDDGESDYKKLYNLGLISFKKREWSKAKNYFESAVLYGDTKSFYYLAHIALNGFVESNHGFYDRSVPNDEAIKFITEGCKAGEEKCIELAYLYRLVRALCFVDVEKLSTDSAYYFACANFVSRERSGQYYKRALEGGSLKAQYMKAVQLTQHPDNRQYSEKIFLKLLDKGLLSVSVNLADLYYDFWMAERDVELKEELRQKCFDAYMKVWDLGFGFDFSRLMTVASASELNRIYDKLNLKVEQNDFSAFGYLGVYNLEMARLQSENASLKDEFEQLAIDNFGLAIQEKYYEYCVDLGMLYFERGKTEEVVDCFRIGFQNGSVQCAYNLLNMNAWKDEFERLSLLALVISRKNSFGEELIEIFKIHAGFSLIDNKIDSVLGNSSENMGVVYRSFKLQSSGLLDGTSIEC